MDAADILAEYADQAGIVVDFLMKTDDYARAVVEYANILEEELVVLERKLNWGKGPVQLGLEKILELESDNASLREQIEQLQERCTSVEDRATTELAIRNSKIIMFEESMRQIAQYPVHTAPGTYIDTCRELQKIAEEALDE